MTRRPLILLAIAAIVGLYLLGVTDRWSIKPDSGLYLGLGQSLAEGRGMAFNGSQWWGIPPLVPLMVAGALRLADGHLLLVNLAMMTLALGVVGLTYLVLRRLAAELPPHLTPGLVAGGTLTVALSARLYIDATCVLTDVPFTFFIMLSLYCWLRGRDGHGLWLLAAAGAMVLATLTRIVAPVFVIAFAMAMLLHFWRQPDRWRRLAWLAASGAIILTAFVVWAVLVRSRAESTSVDYLRPSVLSILDPTADGKWGELGKGLLQVPNAIYSTIVYQKAPWFSPVPAALVIIGAVAVGRRRQWLVVVPLAVYPAFLLLVGGAMASRYMLPLMPLLVYCLLVGTQALLAPAMTLMQATAAWIQRQRLRKIIALWIVIYIGIEIIWHRVLIQHFLAIFVSLGVAVGMMLILLVPLGILVALLLILVGVRRIKELRPWRFAVVVLVVFICVATSLARIGREIYWLHHPDYLEVKDKGRWAGLFEVGQNLKDRGQAGVDQVLGPDLYVLHRISGLPVTSDIVREGQLYLHFDDLSPEAFAEVAAQGPYRFVVIPDCTSAWSQTALEALKSTGQFGPPERIRDLAVLERRPATAGAANPSLPINAGEPSP
jgi:4-amino-4-deoxy-L-arabinose transferase-like glycosyltransferase